MLKRLIILLLWIWAPGLMADVCDYGILHDIESSTVQSSDSDYLPILNERREGLEQDELIIRKISHDGKKLVVEWFTESHGLHNIHIIDILGKPILFEDETVYFPGFRTTEIDINGLPSGTYLIKLSNRKCSVTQTFLK